MLNAMRLWLEEFFLLQAYRKRTGGVWYYVVDWPLIAWTQDPDDDSTIVAVEDYRTRQC